MSGPAEAFFIVGPTAAGKSAAAQQIAEEDGCDIISADSMLVYQGLDIGTDKPARAQRQRVNHWCIDLTPPDHPFNVAMYRRAAVEALMQVANSGKRAIVVGGTGLYVKSLTHGLSPLPGNDPILRAFLHEALRLHGIEHLQNMLRRENQDLYDSLPDKNNERRLIRLIELARTGIDVGPSEWKKLGSGPPLVGLSMPREQLRIRIRQRVERMFASGLLEEIKYLLSHGIDIRCCHSARQAIGYSEAADCLAGVCSREQAIERAVVRTNLLAKRQMTWFRRQANVSWISVDLHSDMTTILAEIRGFWKKHGPTPIAG